MSLLVIVVRPWWESAEAATLEGRLPRTRWASEQHWIGSLAVCEWVQRAQEGGHLAVPVKYETAERVSSLLGFLNTEGESRTGHLPPWEEFCELADDYGIAV